MSVAIIVHKEANAVNGGAMNASALSDTFYSRKLNTLLVNQGSTIVSFDPVNFTFTLGPGQYRLDASVIYNPSASPASGAFGYCVGLYNITSAAFEVFSGGTEPILGTTGDTFYSSGAAQLLDSNRLLRLEGYFAVSSTNKTYQIRHKTNNANWAVSANFCGINDQMTGANVNAAAASQFYMMIKIGRES